MGADNNYQAGVPGSPGQRLTEWLQEFFLKGKTMAGPYAKNDNPVTQSLFNAFKVTPDMAAKAHAPAQGSAWHGVSTDPAEGALPSDPSGVAEPAAMAPSRPAQAPAQDPRYAMPDLTKLSDEDLRNMAAGGVEAAANELLSRQGN